MNKFDIELGEMIRNLRESKGFSQKQLADKLKVHKSTLSLWESGKRQVNIGTLWSISECLSLSQDEKEFFFKEVVKKYNPNMLSVFGWKK